MIFDPETLGLKSGHQSLFIVIDSFKVGTLKREGKLSLLLCYKDQHRDFIALKKIIK
jgi:hypothetical protein